MKRYSCEIKYLNQPLA